MKLYEDPCSGNCHKVRVLLDLLGLPFERVTIDVRAGARPEGFLAGHPSPKVPRLVLDDGTQLAESNAILYYLAEGTPYLPDDKMGRFETLQWMFFEQNMHEPNIATSRFWISLSGNPDMRKDQLPLWHEKGLEALGIMEKHLTANDYFAAGRYTVADIALCAYTRLAHEGGFDLATFPAIRVWLDRVKPPAKTVS